MPAAISSAGGVPGPAVEKWRELAALQIGGLCTFCAYGSAVPLLSASKLAAYGRSKRTTGYGLLGRT